VPGKDYYYAVVFAGETNVVLGRNSLREPVGFEKTEAEADWETVSVKETKDSISYFNIPIEPSW
jgi:hypothetical protein